MKTLLRSISLRKPNRRFVVAGTLATVIALLIIQKIVWQPIRYRMDQSFQIEQQLVNARQQLDRGERAAEYCDRVARQSLSSDPVVVAHRYQEWLMKRTEALGSVSVTPLSPIEETSFGWRVPFTIEGDSEIDKVAELLDEIGQSPLLHRVTYFNAQQDQGQRAKSSGLRFSLTLEALALNGANDLGAIPISEPITGTDSLANFLAKVAPFTQGYFGPPPPVKSEVDRESLVSSPPPEVRPIIDPLVTLTLIGSVEVNGKLQGWVYDQRTEQVLYLTQDEPFQFDSVRGTVRKISSDFVELASDESLIRWSMGATLRSAVVSSR